MLKATKGRSIDATLSSLVIIGNQDVNPTNPASTMDLHVHGGVRINKSTVISGNLYIGEFLNGNLNGFVFTDKIQPTNIASNVGVEVCGNLTITQSLAANEIITEKITTATGNLQICNDDDIVITTPQALLVGSAETFFTGNADADYFLGNIVGETVTPTMGVGGVLSGTLKQLVHLGSGIAATLTPAWTSLTIPTSGSITGPLLRTATGVDENDGNWSDASGLYVIPATGTYKITASGQVSAAAAAASADLFSGRAFLRVNGTTNIAFDEWSVYTYPTGGSTLDSVLYNIQLSFFGDLSAGDEVGIYGAAVSAVRTMTFGDVWTMEIYKVL